MKYSFLPAILLAGSLFVGSCDSKNKEKIEELEQKIAQLEQNQAAQPRQPSNVQSVAQIDPSSLGKFKFDDMQFDFGTIDQGKVVEHTFTFTNDGQSPLIISNVQASCGCTTPDWSKQPVKPGEEGHVKVRFNSAHKSGAQSPTVTITANTSPSITKLKLKGTVNTNSTASNVAGPVKK
ncbi:DUF1573 domain-containing protein [Echinicola vietnamensis]|uniref:DUF1573 domain-containing protein n=1 Tax=Echinicola vietnamensis (strain DSM 17526 / LMG 23754 / KMM 6221) TaxID=926556 RepID=L0FVX5_ECHVK|nr:DUF1573 domain-containing protein [Echinicola vietnamensis]AGA78024.1 Protein of unknown function (DUF1573) [Echinicola vietnamensis DSM 17526]